METQITAIKKPRERGKGSQVLPTPYNGLVKKYISFDSFASYFTSIDNIFNKSFSKLSAGVSTILPISFPSL